MKSEDVIKGKTYFDCFNNRNVIILEKKGDIRYAMIKDTLLLTWVNVKNLEPIKQTMEKETHDFSNAKVGDKVTCLVFGKGEITQLAPLIEYGVFVEFIGHTRRYTRDGRWTPTSNQCLYHGHVDFKIEVVPHCPYEVGEWIAVNPINPIDPAIENQKWFIYKFKGMAEDGVLVDCDGQGLVFKRHKKLSEFNEL